MKKFILAFVLLFGLTALAACGSNDGSIVDEDGYVKNSELRGDYPDARYRGVFIDRGDLLGERIGFPQVIIQFTLEDGIINDISFRALAYGGDNYMVPEDEGNAWSEYDLQQL